MGMMKEENNPYACGEYHTGNGTKTKGYLWFFCHDNHFAVSHCDFTFSKDCRLEMPGESRYIALRLDREKHLSPEKIVAFMEEKGHAIGTTIKKGTRVGYTEILYSPAFYQKHLSACFSNLQDNPIEILKHMGGEHNWPIEMMDILLDVQTCILSGMAAELFYVAKAYELMSALANMTRIRSPKDATDYEYILGVIHYIDLHLQKPIKQIDLVRISNMSATKLKNLFKQFTGRTITEYVLEKKSDQAAHLLIETNLSVEQISKRVGFGTATGFSTSFKK